MPEVALPRTGLRAKAMPLLLLLLLLQAEQARLREEFCGQAAIMDKLARDAGSAALQRDQAWQVSCAAACW